MNTKGVSGVVTAVLLILLVIAAVGVLWVVVQNFVTTQTSDLGSATGCLDTRMKVVEVVSSGPGSPKVIFQRVSGGAEISEVFVYLNDEIIDRPGITFTQDMAVGEIQSLSFSLTSPAIIFAEDDRIVVAAKIGDQICGRSEEVIV